MDAKKPKGGKREGSGRRPEGDRKRAAVTAIRSSEEWKSELESLAEWDRATTVAELIDRAVAYYAKERGYPGSMPMR